MKKDHPNIKFGKTGVLLVNLGTPDSTNWFDIRKYLKEFLSDRRVIELNPILWKIILNLFILNFRPSKTAKAYKEIWMKKEDMSPLRYYTLMQTKKLSEKTKDEKTIVPLMHLWKMCFLPLKVGQNLVFSSKISLKTTMIETTGFDKNVTFDFSNTEIIGRFTPNSGVVLNKEINVYFDLTQISIFDKQTELRL